MNAILQSAAAKGIPTKEIPDRIGITTSYWNALASGGRDIGGLKRDKLQRVAKLINKSVIECDLMAEARTMEDLFCSSRIDDDLVGVRAKMLADPSFNSLALPDAVWEATERRVKILIAVMYERIAGEKLLTRAELILGQRPDIGIFEF